MRPISPVLMFAALLLAGLGPTPDPGSLPPPLAAPAPSPQAKGIRAISPPPIHPHALFLAHNAERKKAGLPALVAVGPLMLAAQAHADEMARRGVLTHQGLDGTWPWDRVTAQGYRWGWCSENAAWNFETVESLMAGWMGSRGHRANILSPQAREVGFGIARGPRGPYHVTVFATPAR